MQLVATVVLCGLSDWIGVRLPSLLIHSAINLASEIILVIRPESRVAMMTGFYLNYMGNVSYVLLAAWATTYLSDEPEVRTITIATGTIMAYLNNGFLTLWTCEWFLDNHPQTADNSSHQASAQLEGRRQVLPRVYGNLHPRFHCYRLGSTLRAAQGAPPRGKDRPQAPPARFPLDLEL